MKNVVYCGSFLKQVTPLQLFNYTLENVTRLFTFHIIKLITKTPYDTNFYCDKEDNSVFVDKQIKLDLVVIQSYKNFFGFKAEHFPNLGVLASDMKCRTVGEISIFRDMIKARMRAKRASEFRKIPQNSAEFRKIPQNSAKFRKFRKMPGFE